MVKDEKIKQVEEIAKEAQDSGAIIFSDYRGLTVSEMGELRKKLAEIGADLKVVKNTLLKFSLEKAKLALSEELTGPTAVLFSKVADPIESIKTLVTFFKAKEKGEVKVGFFEKAQIIAADILSLAALPGKQALQARFVSQLLSPIYGLVHVLNGSRQRFVSVLDKIATAKGGAPLEAVAKSKGGVS